MNARPAAPPDYDPWATQPDPGRRVRAAMTVVAWTALAVVVAGAAIGLSERQVGRTMTGRSGLGLALIGIGLLESVAVVWHGARHAHERGRRLAITALLVGGLAALPLLLRLIFDARGW